MTLCLVTGSTERDWVRALAGLRRRGVGVVVVLLDRHSFVPEPAEEDEAAREERDARRAEVAACRHALAEYDIETHLLHAGDDLGERLGGRIRARA